MTKIQNSSSDNSSSESIIQLHSEKISVEPSKKANCSGNFFIRIFQKLVCSNQNLSDDENEVIIIPKPQPK